MIPCVPNINRKGCWELQSIKPKKCHHYSAPTYNFYQNPCILFIPVTRVSIYGYCYKYLMVKGPSFLLVQNPWVVKLHPAIRLLQCIK